MNNFGIKLLLCLLAGTSIGIVGGGICGGFFAISALFLSYGLALSIFWEIFWFCVNWGTVLGAGTGFLVWLIWVGCIILFKL